MDTINYQGREVRASKLSEVGGFGGELLGRERNVYDQLWRDEAGRYYLRRSAFPLTAGGPEYLHEARKAGIVFETVHAVNVNAAILWAVSGFGAALRRDAAALLIEGQGYSDPLPNPRVVASLAALTARQPVQVADDPEDASVTRYVFEEPATTEYAGTRHTLKVDAGQLAVVEKLAGAFALPIPEFLRLLHVGRLPGQPTVGSRKVDPMEERLSENDIAFACFDETLAQRIERAAQAREMSVDAFVAYCVATDVDMWEEQMVVHPVTGELLHGDNDELYTDECHEVIAAPIGREHEPQFQRSLRGGSVSIPLSPQGRHFLARFCREHAVEPVHLLRSIAERALADASNDRELLGPWVWDARVLAEGQDPSDEWEYLPTIEALPRQDAKESV